MQLSGNKVRKLEFLMAEAKAVGADCVITLGAIQSNHCRATAVAARCLNLDCFLILTSNRTKVDVDPGLMGNLLFERMVGAHIELVSMEEYQIYGYEMLGEMLKEKLLSEGRTPYLVPFGGSNSLGIWGDLEEAREIEEQVRNSTCHADGFDDIVMACGSGGTTAGLALGSHLSTLKARVHAYSICDSPEYFYDYTQGLLDGLNANIASHDIVNIIDAKGIGYAMSTNAELKFIKEIAEATGIVLDPVYSGKALFGLMRDMKKKQGKWNGRKVLFVHTGGVFAMYDKLQQLQPLMSKCNRFQIPKSISGCHE
ncbi:hypothetical protein KP509_16G041500 [Ceratopteris richardii]|nr:hypothetical protein KP509_16G041500 [Ceratopteris richardii]KAH7387797.1 hypothetical protein KP509_16G041500 [Ceratopteris richardii]